MFNRHLIIPLIACGIIGLPALIYESDLFEKRPEETASPDPYGWMAPVASPPLSPNVALLPAQPQTMTTPVNPASSPGGWNAPNSLSAADSVAWSQAYGQSPFQTAASSDLNPPAMSASAGPAVNHGINGAWGADAQSQSYSVPPPVQPPIGSTNGNAWGVPASLSASPVAASGTFPGSLPVQPMTQPMTFQPVISFYEILNWDLTPDMIRSRFDRITVLETDYGLQGMRVPLVTGVNLYDLHGSLTWFFDESDTLQRISFRGWTGDATALANILETQFGLSPPKGAGSHLYVARRGRKVTSAALFKFAPVLETRKSNEQIVVAFELNNPAGGYILSQEFASGVPELR